MPTLFISHAHVQLRPGDINRRHYPAKIKASPQSVGMATPGMGRSAGDHCGGGSWHWQGAKEPAWGGTAAAAEAASPPHTGEDKHQPGTDELVQRQAAMAVGAAASASGSDQFRSWPEGPVERLAVAAAEATEGTHFRDG